MRISDWSSDVCSSDLLLGLFGEHVGAAMAERDVAGAAGRGRHADADERAGDAVEACGLGIDRDDMRGARFLDPAVERLDRRHGFVKRAVDGGPRRESDERRGGKACGSTCWIWWCAYHLKK